MRSFAPHPALRLLRAALAVAGILALRVPAARAQGTIPAGFSDSLLVGGLDFPVGMAFLPDGRLLVVEQKSAKIRLIRNGVLAATDPVATVPAVNTSGSERGLLGITVDPGWPARPYLYIHCNNAGTSTIRITRYTAAGDLTGTGDGGLTVDPATGYDLLNDAPDQFFNHNGGTLRFGHDNMMYASLGEDADACAAQDTVSLRGVILRLDVSNLPPGPGGPAPRSLVTPPDNPFAGHPNANARLVWALGLRNPFRFQVDALDGTLWVGDVGENKYEEIDHVMAGGLCFGWPAFEGGVAHPISCTNAIVRGTDPVYYYDRTGFTAAVICAGAYHRPAGASGGFPAEYEGNVFFNDYYAGFLRRIAPSDGVWVIAAPVAGQGDPINWGSGFVAVSDWVVGPDGALWYCRQSNASFQNNTGEIRRIIASATLSVPPAGEAAAEFLPPYPTPAPGFANLSWVLRRAAQVELTVFDAGGRRVRQLVRAEQQNAGPHGTTWDGIDDQGRAARPGLFVARLLVDGVAYERRIPLIR